MIQQLILVAVTAVLSSLLTLTLAYLFFKLRLKAQLKVELEEIAETFKERVKGGLEESGKELLPRFREEVREGFKEALTEAMSGGLIEKAATDAIKKSSNIMENGLNFFLGKEKDQE